MTGTQTGGGVGAPPVREGEPDKALLTPAPPPRIYAALSAVMADVGAVKKGDRNTQQNYSFRGVDTVVQAVYPALVRHKVTVMPNVRQYDHGTVEVGKNRTPMGHARVVVEYTFTAVDGSAVVCSAAGEAMDSGDKATPKAMSVALRTALLQALMLPTDDPDPDADSYERTNAATFDQAKHELWAVWTAKHGADLEGLQAAFAQWSGWPLDHADEAQLREFAQSVRDEPDRSAGPEPVSGGVESGRKGEPASAGPEAPADHTRQEGQ